MLFILQCLLLLHAAFGGTHCPPRNAIRPCICLDQPIGKKKVETTLICHNLEDGKSIEAIHPGLLDMEIDKFLLYDSFWKMEPKRSTDHEIPVNLFNTYRITEINVVDTLMMHFSCPTAVTCGTNYVKRLTSINSTLNERQSCTNNGLTISAWISCPNSVEYIEINNGFPAESTLKSEFFPQHMSKLKELNLSNNKFIKIDRRTFSIAKFPVLHTLNLSSNFIRDLKQVFSSPMKIKTLDLSSNSIRSALEFNNLPHLKNLILANNHISNFLENEWGIMSPSLIHLDLSSNDLKCDCLGFKWVNSTFHINTNLLGSCSSPVEVAGMKLRKASRTLNDRCNEQGVIGSRSKVRKG